MCRRQLRPPTPRDFKYEKNGKYQLSLLIVCVCLSVISAPTTE